MSRMARMVGEATLIPLTVQRYYALDFSPTAPVVADATAVPSATSTTP